MALLNREAVYVALFNLLAANPAIAGMFTTRGRLLRHHADVDDSECPALFTFQLPERRQQMGRGIPAKRTLSVAYIAYFSTANATAQLPATMVNAAADALDNAITNPGNPDNAQTLGGLVEHVYIEPEIRPYEGLLQEKSVLVAVVSALVP